MMATGLFETDRIREIVDSLDWNEVAKRTVGLAEDYMPGAAYLANNGEIGYAETMGEVDGLILALAREQDDDESEEPDTAFELASWIGIVSPAAADRAERAFEVIYRELR